MNGPEKEFGWAALTMAASAIRKWDYFARGIQAPSAGGGAVREQFGGFTAIDARA